LTNEFEKRRGHTIPEPEHVAEHVDVG